MPTSKKHTAAQTASPLQSNVTVSKVLRQPKTTKPSIFGGGTWIIGHVNKFDYMAVLLDEPSLQYGIQGGTIRKLEIKDANGQRVAFYDKEWEGGEPTNTAVKKAVKELVSYFATYSFDNSKS